ncbi:2,3-bisphosphoglycerate-independent phosphoglycerate mutase {ECO:0000255/HAMAP-Rule:MF_01038} Short=BPG-independent PGAM {ECO:0000255/HAMAP-Rule:MF_01038}; Short=Phosphoglyceromutase {ECO:0000255/HAMAP-Rule:MF_01038}; Short=iPGM {ECO:0000255/HAMAP-Rule:MF_01038}; {ECO:0000255/HAMAP-Rule:MF_01038} [Serendipita indica DSM 11827]|nr:2,3-bisphosphoglycerate-independent phosphoglycerate mutase {ECO:0000255/HAMAP-Rule:MF_01038} Short=BPG-independent PGAM {ECO:0000255/HAMAP-Rule:MF_01038}; Short=Phosphoglyceromutase {ECO:0000255/HAMAP-Rule:MF_01038}; Short=iPGM {ECO:0000255/HAMAP-Rule:MF_01038}; {ECO:0000255/HAMAP-Rule:MF_01038} [Serendipita indica DSM 11827]
MSFDGSWTSVHDGWGISDVEKGNAVKAGNTETMDKLANEYAYRTIAAHGLAVGLSDGLMGNSEVGHLNIGAGRIVWQDIVRIDQSIRKKQFHKSEVIRASMQHAKDGNGRLHLLGLVSDGGVHSHNTHLYALLETAKEMEVPECYVHFFGDGRDTAPRSAKKYAEELLDFIKNLGYGEVSTVVGRYYAMDRDKRWERVKIAVDGLVSGEGQQTDDLLQLIEEKYKENQTDEFLKPIICGSEGSRIKGKSRSCSRGQPLTVFAEGDTLFFFNYRSDRMREIVSVFGLEPKPMEVTVPKDLHITTMSRYNTEFPFPIAFPPQGMSDVLAEWISSKAEAGPYRWCVTRVVTFMECNIHLETEKYAHVTFFFNGGVEKQFEQEERFLINSPKVATYDLQPQMSAPEVAEKVAEVVKTKEYDFVMCNFAPPDMVGHTGKLEAATEAISHTDKAVNTIYQACKEAGYVLAITADHGNAEQMINPDTGAPHTAHTTNPVPFIIVSESKEFSFAEDPKDAEEGALCDVAPTVLAIMGLDQPADMTGRSLLA